jgi:hypothetical protein
MSGAKRIPQTHDTPWLGPGRVGRDVRVIGGIAEGHPLASRILRAVGSEAWINDSSQDLSGAMSGLCHGQFPPSMLILAAPHSETPQPELGRFADPQCGGWESSEGRPRTTPIAVPQAMVDSLDVSRGPVCARDRRPSIPHWEPLVRPTGAR